MICNEVRSFLSAYHDGELSADRRAEVENHLAGCDQCKAELSRLVTLSQSIRSIESFPAPDSLFRSTDRIVSPKKPWRSFGSGIAVGLAVAVLAILFIFRPTKNDLTADLVSDHIRSLMASHLFDVPSSDQHTVKPWFLGRIDFAPTVPDLTPEGYPLLGGRMDYVGGSTAAALVYGKQKHVINVFVMPDRGNSSAGELNGYRIEHWRTGDLGYWAVSDVSSEDLKSFAKTFQQRQ